MDTRPIRLELLGGLELRFATGAPVLLGARKVRALLAYLALAPTRAHSRDKLAALLWADSDAEQARSSLRQALTTLRKALGPCELVVADGESVALAAAGWSCDADEFSRLAAEGTAASLGRAVNLYRGDLLEGFHARAPAFDDWLTVERERLRNLALLALARLADIHEAAGSLDEALAAAARLVALDPLREEVHRSLMRLYLRQGRQAAALKQYRLCRAALQRELGVSPEPETERLHREILQVRRMPATGSPLAEEAPAPDDLPAPALDHRDAPAADPRPADPELRQSTVVFAEIAGFDAVFRRADPEAMHDVLSRFREAFNAAVVRFGGVVTSHAGARGMAVFGTPLAHGNENERALRAAFAVAAAMPALAATGGPPLRLRAGLASGRVLATRDEIGLAVSGEPVGMAERVMAVAASGEILLSRRVRQGLGERVEAERLDDRALAPGEPASALWRACAWRDDAPPSSATPFVGRRTERRQLAGIVEDCSAEGRGRVLVLRGEAGMGKSRLAEELAREAAALGFACHRVLVLDFGGDADPLCAMAARLLDLRPGAGQDAREAALVRALADGDLEPALHALARDVLELPLPAALAADLEAMDSAARRRGRQALLGQLAQAASRRQPLLMTVEDVHWAQPATLDELSALAAALRESPAILALTTRTESDPIDAAWRSATRGACLTTIDLGPLSTSEAFELATHYGTEEAGFVGACVGRAEGNPLFLDQLLRAGPGAQGAVPGSLQALVLARLDRLAPSDRRTLQAASVLGQRFSAAPLGHLAGEAADCARLVEQGLVRREGENCLFVHALIHEAVYASMLKSRRHEWHQQAAAWFEERDPDLAAQHLDAAADPRAPAAYLRAARAEAARHRNDLALRRAERGLDLAGERALWCDLSMLRADLLRELGDSAASVEAFRQALEMAEEASQVCRGWLGVAAGLRVLDRHREALAALESAEQAARGPECEEALARIDAMRGNLYFPLGDVEACLAAHRRVHERAIRSGSPALEAEAQGGLGDAWYQRGHMRTAREHFDRCVTLARRHGLRRLEVGNLPMLAVTTVYCGELAEALAHARAALELAKGIGDLRGQLIAHIVLAAITPDADHERAREHAGQALDLARRLGARRFEAEALGSCASTLTASDPAAARRLLEEACAVSREAGDTYIGPILHGWAALVADGPGERRRLLAEGEAILARGCVSHCYLHFHELAMRAALQAQDWDEAERQADALARYTAAEPLPWADLHIRQARALARHARQGDGDSLEALRSLRAEVLASGFLAGLPLLEAALGPEASAA